MHPLSDISETCRALISLTQQGAVGLMCTAGMLICSWKGRRSHPVGRQEEIKQDFLLSIFTPVHIIPLKKKIQFPSLKNAECNIQIWQGKRLKRGNNTKADPNACPWKSSCNILTGWEKKWGKPRSLHGTWTVWCNHFMLHCILKCMTEEVRNNSTEMPTLVALPKRSKVSSCL